MTTPLLHRSCGITIEAPRPLPGVPRSPAAAEGGADLRFVDADHPAPVDRALPAEAMLLTASSDRRPDHAAVDTGHGPLLRGFGHCDVQWNPELSFAEVTRDPSATPRSVDRFLATTALAFALTLRGACVLRASTVEVDGKAYVFAGHPGTGTTTSALAACAAGAKLVADDLTVIEEHDGELAVPRGHTAVRIRPRKLERLAGSAPWAAASRRPDSSDGAHGTEGTVAGTSRVDATHSTARAGTGPVVVDPPATARATVPLAGVVLPRPARRATALTIEPLPARTALYRLIGLARLTGFQRPEPVRHHFEAVGRVARRVPVRVVTIPWGPAMRADTGERLLEALP